LTYLGAIERPAVSASITVLERLARALGVHPWELIRLKQRRQARRPTI
jgi:hypothetical protein